MMIAWCCITRASATSMLTKTKWCIIALCTGVDAEITKLNFSTRSSINQPVSVMWQQPLLRSEKLHWGIKSYIMRICLQIVTLLLICIYSSFFVAWENPSSKSVTWESCYPLTCGDRVISVWLGQYHGCWCPGSLRRQDINSHDIDYVE